MSSLNTEQRLLERFMKLSIAAAVVTSPGDGAAAAVVPLKTYSSCLKVILCQILHDTSSLQHVGGGV